MPGVASDALDLDVAANERKFGFRIVIEKYFFPFLWGMTGLAFLAVLPRVYIVQPVAVRALRWRGFVALAGVTALAADLFVGVF